EGSRGLVERVTTGSLDFARDDSAITTIFARQRLLRIPPLFRLLLPPSPEGRCAPCASRQTEFETLPTPPDQGAGKSHESSCAPAAEIESNFPRRRHAPQGRAVPSKEIRTRPGSRPR